MCKRKIDKNIIDKAIREYFEEKISLRKIAKRYNISGSTLKHWIIKSGSNILSNNDLNQKFDKDIINDAIKEYFDSGKSLEEVSMKFNMSSFFLKKSIIKSGFKPRTISESHNNKYKGIKDKAINEYFNGKESLKKVAKKHNVSGGILRYWIINSGLKPRTSSEWNRKFDNELIDTAIQVYINSKKSVKEVAKEYNLPYDVLKHWIKKSGVKIRNSGSYKISKIDRRNIDMAIKEYFDSNKSLDEIASKYNVHGVTLRNWILKAGLKPRTNSEWQLDKEKIKECGKLYLEGISTKELAIKFSVSTRTIPEWLRMCGIDPQTFAERCGVTDEIKKKAIDLYVNEKLNCCEISKIIGVSNRSILDWVKDVKRTMSEVKSILIDKNGSVNTIGRRGKVITPLGEIYCDSSWEEDRIKQHLSDENVKTVRRCKDHIQYLTEDGKTHRYNPDLYIEYIDGKKAIEEIKPFNMIKIGINLIKFKAAKSFYNDKDVTFRVVTEQHIYGKSVRKKSKETCKIIN